MNSKELRRSAGGLGHDFSNVLAALSQYRSTSVVFVPNVGNAGDSLLNLGGYQLIQESGLKYEVGHMRERYPNRVIILGGGGGLVSPYHLQREFILANHSICEALLLLPHTVRSYEDLWASLDSRHTLFARDEITADFLKAHAAPDVSVEMAHDLALYTDLGAVRRKPWSDLAPRRAFRYEIKLHVKRYRILRKLYRVAISSDSLSALRTDSERTSVKIPEKNFDISALLQNPNMAEVDCIATVKYFIRAIEPFERVFTNRLHVGILSAMLGKKVFLGDNSYGKNLSVYRQSLSKLNNIEIMNYDDFPQQRT